jgi:uncharacterized protein (TIGR02996 family)
MNEETFLSALHESPTDEVTWLALADWLEEDGQAERAELLRLVRRLRTLPVMKRTRKRAALEDRVAALLEAGVRPVVPEITNGVGMRLALIPPGTFRMGSPPRESGRDGNDEKVREVTITRAFYLGVFPVTQRQYESVVGGNPSSFRHPGGSSVVLGMDTADFPVEMVSWPEAVAFCEALERREGRAPGGPPYRLPTDAEWEYACRGGAASTGPFPFGASLCSTQANFKGDEPYGGADDGPYLARTCRVGSYRPNAFGLYDVVGNVFEWCHDWIGPLEGVVDPTGPATGTQRVLRGGSCFNAGRHCRSALRGGSEPDDHNSFIGFRVVLGPALGE